MATNQKTNEINHHETHNLSFSHNPPTKHKPMNSKSTTTILEEELSGG